MEPLGRDGMPGLHGLSGCLAASGFCLLSTSTVPRFGPSMAPDDAGQCEHASASFSKAVGSRCKVGACRSRNARAY